MDKVQEHIEKVREALLVASPFPWKWEDGNAECKDLGRFDDANGWTICDFGNHAQYYPTAGKEPDETDYTLIANAPSWLEQSLDIIEQQQREIERAQLQIKLLEQVTESTRFMIEENVRLREVLEQAQFHLQSEQYMTAETVVDEALNFKEDSNG